MFTALTILLLLSHVYAWVRLVREPRLPAPWRHVASGLLIAGLLLVAGGRWIRLDLPREIARPLALVGFSWVGLMAFVVLMLLATDAVRLVASWRARRRGPVDPDRRQFLHRALAGTTALGAGGLFVIGTTQALGEIDVAEVPVRLPRLPNALDGLRVVQLSDVHIGPLLDQRFLQGVIDKVNALKPDLVVITGDLVDAPRRVIGPEVAALSTIRSRFGTFFCTGNHEYYAGAGDWLPFLARHGLRTLNNERVVIGDRAASIDLAGIPDPRGNRFHPAHVPDLARTLHGRDPERECLLLSHRPNPIVEAADLGVGLQLSGHTHGGQFFPATVIASMVHPYNAGLHHHTANSQIYVSRGTGFWGPPIRVLAPAEITLLPLTT